MVIYLPAVACIRIFEWGCIASEVRACESLSMERAQVNMADLNHVEVNDVATLAPPAPYTGRSLG